MKYNRVAIFNKSHYTNIRRFFSRIINWNFELNLFEPRACPSSNNCEFVRRRQLSFLRKVTPIKTFLWSDSNGILPGTYKRIFLRFGKQPGKRELHIVLGAKMISWFCWPSCIFQEQQWGCSGNAFYVKRWMEERRYNTCEGVWIAIDFTDRIGDLDIHNMIMH